MIDIQPNGILEDDVPLTPVYGTPIDHPGAPDQRLRYLRALHNPPEYCRSFVVPGSCLVSTNPVMDTQPA